MKHWKMRTREISAVVNERMRQSPRLEDGLRICEQCGETYSPIRPQDRFCSGRCHQTFKASQYPSYERIAA